MQSEQPVSEALPSADTMLDMMKAAGGVMTWDLVGTQWTLHVLIPNCDELVYSYTNKSLDSQSASAYADFIHGTWSIGNEGPRAGKLTGSKI